MAVAGEQEMNATRHTTEYFFQEPECRGDKVINNGNFPIQERETSSTGYKEMSAERREGKWA